MGPGRPLGDAELVSDRPVRQAAGDAAQDLPLAGGQRGQASPTRRRAAPAGDRRAVAHPPGDDPGDGRVEVDLAGRRGPDRRGQVVRLGVLEQEPRRAGLDRGDDACLLDEARERDDLDRRVARP